MNVYTYKRIDIRVHIAFNGRAIMIVDRKEKAKYIGICLTGGEKTGSGFLSNEQTGDP